jgi:ribosome-associated protein
MFKQVRMTAPDHKLRVREGIGRTRVIAQLSYHSLFPLRHMKEPSEPSKTQRKRDMLALQQLGEELILLPTERLNSLELPEDLLDAILEARRITKWGALRRQRQYIGRLMREIDAQAIRARLEDWNNAAARDLAPLTRAERWRERLLRDDDALRELLSRFPDADEQRLRTLIHAARHEVVNTRPAHNFRALFRALRALFGESL